MKGSFAQLEPSDSKFVLGKQLTVTIDARKPRHKWGEKVLTI